MIGYREKILEAIKLKEVKDVFRGSKKYLIEPPKFVPDVFPTDINQTLVEYFYKQESISNIQEVLEKTLIQLAESSVVDVYIATLFLDAIVFMEEQQIATFKINIFDVAQKISQGIQKHMDELAQGVTFKNGLKKDEPLKVILQINKRFQKKYNLSICKFNDSKF